MVKLKPPASQFDVQPTEPPVRGYIRCDGCNCRIKDQCPLDNKYLTTSVIYKANVTTDYDNTGKNYIGLTEGTFKQRYPQP